MYCLLTFSSRCSGTNFPLYESYVFVFDLLSNTFDRLQLDTDCIWKFQHYYLVCHHLTRPCLPPPFIAFSHFWRVTLYFFSRVIQLPWFTNQYIQHRNRAKFSMFKIKCILFFDCGILEIVVDEKLTRHIESIEDALGNEVYYFYSKTTRKLFDRQTDFHEERV